MISHGDIEVHHLEAEREVSKTIFHDSKPTCFRDFLKTINALPSSIKLKIPAFTKLCGLILSNPATSCTAERSFSTARRLKRWLRSTMTNLRFNSLAILKNYKAFTDTLDLTLYQRMMNVTTNLDDLLRLILFRF